eukprot:CAMPEP_0184125832 /NCGR_PEP_ID=MMETSP0974-20121125/25238_1 /TAXON_ID=483370 /ORGANISM="non described non described, Strain CCMP2097" /LENGTH=161 /DNA_ID=CAMNT_0026429177 /DNA_START=17 /DNA_END=499 /DNA_ORIENTATION=+
MTREKAALECVGASIVLIIIAASAASRAPHALPNENKRHHNTTAVSSERSCCASALASSSHGAAASTPSAAAGPVLPSLSSLISSAFASLSMGFERPTSPSIEPAAPCARGLSARLPERSNRVAAAEPPRRFRSGLLRQKFSQPESGSPQIRPRLQRASRA